MALYVAGAALVIGLNVMLLQAGPTQPVTHMPGAAPEMLGEIRVGTPSALPEALWADGEEDEEGALSGVQVTWLYVAGWIGRALDGLVGEHGLLSHFPMMVVGVLGAVWVLHRNWTASTKALAGVTLISGILIIVTYTFADYRRMSYGTPWFVCISPLLLLWAGAWLKHTHRRNPGSWWAWYSPSAQPSAWSVCTIPCQEKDITGIVSRKGPFSS